MSEKETPAAAKASPAAPAAPAPPVLDQLEAELARAVGGQVDGVLQGAHVTLNDMAMDAKSQPEQQLYQETIRLLRQQRAPLMQAFRGSLQEALRSSRGGRAGVHTRADDITAWSLEGDEETDEKVIISNLDARARDVCAQAITELNRRLAAVTKASGFTPHEHYLGPAAFFGAFRDAMKTVDAPFPVKRVVYQIADTAFTIGMRDIYATANRILDAAGYVAERGARFKRPERAPNTRRGEAGHPDTPLPPPQAPEPGNPHFDVSRFANSLMQSAGLAPPGGGEGGAPNFMPGFAPADAAGGGAAPPGFPGGGAAAGASPGGGFPMGGAAGDPGAMAAGGASGGMPGMPGMGGGGGGGYNDYALATDIGQALAAMAQGRAPANWVPAGNVAAVGGMFDRLNTFGDVRPEFQPAMSRLQMPVLKAALADPAYLRQASHPARQVVLDLYQLLSSDLVPDEQTVALTKELAEQAVKLIDVDSSKLADPEQRAPEASDEELAKFVAEEHKRMEEVREERSKRARKFVTQEIRLRTGGKRFPRAAIPVLQGFTEALLQFHRDPGVGSEIWKDTLQLLERMLASFGDAPATEQAAVVVDIGERFADAGLAPDVVDKHVAALKKAYADPGGMVGMGPAPAPAPAADAAVDIDLDALDGAMPKPAPTLAPAPAPAPTNKLHEARQALGQLMSPGAWFRINDPATGAPRWLKSRGYTGHESAVLFEHFVDSRQLKVDLGALVHDLIDRRAAPVEAGPMTGRLLELIAPLGEAYPRGAVSAIWIEASA